MARTLTGNNRRREQRLQEVMLARTSQQFERRLSREIARAMRAGATALDNGRVSPADQITAEHRRRLTRLMETLWRASMVQMAEHMTGTRRSWAGKLEAKNLSDVEPTEVVDRLMSAWMADAGARKITQIAYTTRENIRTIIESGIQSGLSERDIAKQIREIAPTKSASRAQTIARTEVHAASQASAQEVAEQSGLAMVKVWVASNGERTRPDHDDADGQRVGMNEAFEVGGESLMYPGDPMGSAAQVINCRCAVVYELE